MDKLVSQLDADGYFVAPVVADLSPLEEDVYLIPGGAVDVAPPVVPIGKRARWNSADFDFDIEDILPPPAPPTPTLSEIKAAKNAAINAARAAANTGTFAHGGKTFSCDALSRGDIDGMNGYVAIFAALPAVFPGEWKAADNTFLPIPDVAAWKAFYSAMVLQGVANFAHAQDLKAQLVEATTPAAVAALVW